MNDPQQRDRQRRIAAPPSFASTPEPRSQNYAPNSTWVLGIVRNVVGDLITWQRLRYKRGQKPTFGEYEAYGTNENGYPLEGKRGTDYAALKVTGPIPSAAVPIRAMWRDGYWIIETIGGGGSGTVFPVLLTKTGGLPGTASSAASFTYTVKDYFTGATLALGYNPSGSGMFRRPIGQVTEAYFGYAHRSEGGGLIVGWVNEMQIQEVCGD